MTPEETMIADVENLRAKGMRWKEVAEAIGSTSGPAAMKRYQRAKKVGPYSKPLKRKPRSKKPVVGLSVISENNDPNAQIIQALIAGINELEVQRERLHKALSIVEGTS